MDDAKKFSDVIGPILRNCREVEGVCDTHGHSTAMLHPRLGPQEWFCGECALEQRKREELSEWQNMRKQTLDRSAGLPERYAGKRFDAHTPAQRSVRVTARAFRDSVVAARKWGSLILIGGTGTGKTLMACELAQSLIDNLLMSVRYCTASQMISEIQASYKEDGKSEEGEILRFTQYELLILDEVDAIRSTENTSMLLTEVINRRYNEQRPVVVISNQPLERLPKFIGDRVFSRLQENSFMCAHDWPDQRIAGNARHADAPAAAISGAQGLNDGSLLPAHGQSKNNRAGGR